MFAITAEKADVLALLMEAGGVGLKGVSIIADLSQRPWLFWDASRGNE